MNESIDRVLAAWLREGPESGPREGLERALAATRRVGQRPGWTLPERWLPMQLTMARTRSQRPVLALVMLALMVVALVASAIVIGSLQSQTPSLHRNGAVVWAADGDLFIADELGGTPRPLLADPATDSNPIISPQGDRVAFVRREQDEFQLMSVGLDGSNLRMLATPGVVTRLDWAPDGSAILVSTFGLDDWYALKVIQGDGSGSRTLDLADLEPHDATWRPDGRHIVFRGKQDGDAAATFIADADGANVRRLPIGRVEWRDGLEWSPDGRHLSFLTAGGPHGMSIGIVDIDAEGGVTAQRRPELDLPVGEAVPRWSPDGSMLAFQVVTDSGHRVGIANADGSGYRTVGPEVYEQRAIDLTWAPDGRSLVIFEHPRNVPDVPVGPYAKVWSVDVATGEHTEFQTPVWSWQRLAP